MSLSEGDSELPADPFGDAGAEGMGGEEVAEEKPFNVLGLRNTYPDDALHQVRGQVDFEANWYDHIGAMLLKQSEGDGVEAWVHGVIAIVILVKQQQEGEPADEGERQEEAVAESEGEDAGIHETYSADEIFGG